MKRRVFLKKLGIASGVAMVAPMAVGAFVPEKEGVVTLSSGPVTITLPKKCEGMAFEFVPAAPCSMEFGSVKGVWLVDPGTGETIKIE